jgi:hypothetical protein
MPVTDQDFRRTGLLTTISLPVVVVEGNVTGSVPSRALDAKG